VTALKLILAENLQRCRQNFKKKKKSNICYKTFQ